MAPKLPQAVIAMMAERSHRIHHYLWHEVRNGWLSYSPEDRKRIAALGWEPPSSEKSEARRKQRTDLGQ